MRAASAAMRGRRGWREDTEVVKSLADLGGNKVKNIGWRECCGMELGWLSSLIA